MTSTAKLIKIAVVGDVHDQWEALDQDALESLSVDLVLFVGDFGNESVEVVQAIASLPFSKAVILGNHDAWYSASAWGRKQCPYNRRLEDRVQKQLDLLGSAHVGYGKLDFPDLNISVVGSRPFSWGGPQWKNEDFYRERFKIKSFSESSERIVEAASQTACDNLIFLGHNGPLGLGDKLSDPCGKDWEPSGGDFGDPDLAVAIAKVRTMGKKIPLVVFGHMHHNLARGQGLRTAVSTDGETIYYNSASVPRIKDSLRNFSLIVLENGIVEEISLLWLNRGLTVDSKHIFYRRSQ